jgi:quercetin dioxygenase-like cupin family protein
MTVAAGFYNMRHDGIVVGGEKHRLLAGDSAHYNSVVPHIVKAGGDGHASIYGVVFTPF